MTPLNTVTVRTQVDGPLLAVRYREGQVDAIYIVWRDYRYQHVNAAFEHRWRMPAERIVSMGVGELSSMEPFEEQPTQGATFHFALPARC